MTRREWMINFLIVFGIWFIDFITKWAAMTYIRVFDFYGPVGLVLHYNPGAMLGVFSGLPPILRIVSLSTGGIFLCFIYLALQFLIPHSVHILRMGMSILLSGILGNVTDRILRGAVTDFIVLGSPTMASPAFNVADVVQWVGYGMIVYSLIREGHLFWPEQNSRRTRWVNPAFQVKYVGLLMVIALAFVSISGVFFYTYLKITIDALTPASMLETERRFLIPFFITFSVVSFGFLLALYIIGRTVSHRMAGPLYAFEKFVEDLLAGKDRGLRLRAGDEFTHLEELSDKLRVRFKLVADKEAESLPDSLPKAE